MLLARANNILITRDVRWKSYTNPRFMWKLNPQQSKISLYFYATELAHV